MGWKSSRLPGLKKLKQKQRAVKAIAFLFFTFKDIEEVRKIKGEVGGDRRLSVPNLLPDFDPQAEGLPQPSVLWTRSAGQDLGEDSHSGRREGTQDKGLSHALVNRGG